MKDWLNQRLKSLQPVFKQFRFWVALSHLDRGNALSALERYEAAIEIIESYDRALQIKPDDHKDWLNQRLKSLQPVFKQFRFWVALSHLDRGNALSDLERYEAAIESYDRALQIKPDDHDAWINRAKALNNLGRYEAATESYSRSSQIKLAAMLRRYEAAFESYESALQTKLDRDAARLNQRSTFRSYEAMIESYTSVLQTNPDSPNAWFYRGKALAMLERYEAAIESYNHALQLNPNKYEAWNNRGSALSNLGRYDEAIESYDRALHIQPDDHSAWNNRGYVFRSLERYEEAIESFDRALHIQPDDHSAWNNRGYVFRSLERYEEAIESFDRAIQLKPNYHEAWINRGNALNNLGRYDEAIESYDRALQIKPDEHIAWFVRGFTLFDIDRYEAAIESFDRMLELCSREALPQEWTTAKVILALISLIQYAETKNPTKLEQAFQGLQGVAEVLQGIAEITDFGRFSSLYLQRGFGEAFTYRHQINRNLDDLQQAIIAYQQAASQSFTEQQRLKIEGLVAARQLQLGTLLTTEGRWYDGLDLLQQSLDHYRQGDDLTARANVILQLAQTHFQIGNLENAQVHYSDALRLYEHTQYQPGIAHAKTGYGQLLLRLGRVAAALPYLQAAAHLYQELQDSQRLATLQPVLTFAQKLQQKQAG